MSESKYLYIHVLDHKSRSLFLYSELMLSQVSPHFLSHQPAQLCLWWSPWEFCFCNRRLLVKGGRAYPVGRSCAAPCSLLDSSSKSTSHQNFPLCDAGSVPFRNETMVSLCSVQKVSAYPANGAWADSAIKAGLSLALGRYSGMIHPWSKRGEVSNCSHECCV